MSGFGRTGLSGLNGLAALLQFGGFVVTPKLAQGLRFGGEVADEVGAVSPKAILHHGNKPRVARLSFFGLAPLIIEVTQAAERNGDALVVALVHGFVNLQ